MCEERTNFPVCACLSPPRSSGTRLHRGATEGFGERSAGTRVKMTTTRNSSSYPFKEIWLLNALYYRE